MGYRPRHLEENQKNYRVDVLSEQSNGGSYGYGETLEEAEKNAKYYFNRDFRNQDIRAKVIQKWVDNHWEEILSE